MDDWYSTLDEQFTHHARARMAGRGIRTEEVDLALSFGRVVEARGAEIFVVGRREVEKAQSLGVALEDLEGLHVVCAQHGGPVLTCYRNRNLRSTRDRTRHAWQSGAWKKAA